MNQYSEVPKIAGEIAEYVQEKCRDCPTVKLGSMLLAEKVLAGEVDLQEIKEEYAHEINSDCYGGEVMMSGRLKCWKGLRTPVTPQHLREDI